MHVIDSCCFRAEVKKFHVSNFRMGFSKSMREDILFFLHFLGGGSEIIRTVKKRYPKIYSAIYSLLKVLGKYSVSQLLFPYIKIDMLFSSWL